ncbi:MAG: glycogen/starch synthase [Flavobacteriales bacterium]|nr:glycogen/starch synthase [Flavobacteriales bacterium]
MENLKILYISQEITPFLPESPISNKARRLPQYMNENGHEIRVFMPRFGVINERRHQLHEVIRLSGMNLVINDSDHPLIIKVASIPQVRMQVYFIDNEEYFKRKAVFKDEDEKFFEDNDERSLFFCKGVLETVKKLGWKPDIIHCHGWMSSMVPMLVKRMFHEDPHFENSRIIYSAYKNDIQEQFDNELIAKYEYDEIDAEHVEVIRDASLLNLHKLALQYADAVIMGDAKVDKGLDKAIEEAGLPTLDYQGEEDYEAAYEEFYKTVFEEVEALV